MNKCISKLDIISPKQNKRERKGTAKWYPYYAGFSYDFAERLIKSAALDDKSIVFDPWNGSGTSTIAASELNIKSIGYDLNPVMAIIAKARLISTQSKNSLLSLARDIIKSQLVFEIQNSDPLCLWFVPSSVCSLRSIEYRIKELLIDNNINVDFTANGIDCVSDIACFFYVALFRIIRLFIKPFTASNPTWIKKPKTVFNRVKPSKHKIYDVFISTVTDMIDDITYAGSSESYVGVESSKSVPLTDNSVDFILSSPPYCTRIDYAAATSPELALLNFKFNDSYKVLRDNLIGTTTINNNKSLKRDKWGETCWKFLKKVRSHDSKASLSYYYKNFKQYYSDISESCSELSRVLKDRGQCHIIVQDSYYKGIHNDLPKIISEMMNNYGLSLTRSEEFIQRSSMANKNPNISKYRKKPVFNEKVLCFVK